MLSRFRLFVCLILRHADPLFCFAVFQDMLSAIAILRRQSYAGKKAPNADEFTDI